MLVTEKTTVIGHFLGTETDLLRPFILKDSNKTDRAKRLATIYLKYDRKFNIRADIAFAQMCHETGMLQFTGIAKPEWNNFCGLGITGPGAKQEFKTEELGVLAHFVHLAWYYYPDHINSLCGREFDPRHFEAPGKHHPKYTGDLTIGFLRNQWAVPGDVYAQKIAYYANVINNTLDNSLEDVELEPVSVIEPVSPIVETPVKSETDKYDIIVQMGHKGIYKGMTGTPGEREWNIKLGEAMKPLLDKTGLNYKLVDGLVALPVVSQKCKVFMSLHCDGSTDPRAHGYTLGFKPNTNEAFKNALSDSWGKFSGFTKRKENSTSGLRLYYYWTSKKENPKSKYYVPPMIADYYALLEHAFFTNSIERKWLESNIDRIAKHHVDLISKFIGNIK